MKRRAQGRRLLVNLSLLAVSTVAALLLSEVALRAIGFAPMYVSPERDRFWKYDSYLGWTHRPGQEGVFESPQFRTSVRINQKGLRDQEHPYDRTSERERILVLGDSFAWGYGVEASQRFSEHLADSLGVDVINAGVSGYSTDQELLWLQSEGVKYDIDLVLLVLAGNDVGDNHRQLVSTIYYKPRFVLENGQLKLTDSPVPEASTRDKSVYFLCQRSALAFFLVQRYFELQANYRNFKGGDAEPRAAETGEEPGAKAFDLTLALLDAIRDSANSRDAGFMIVATDSWWNAPSTERYETFVELLEDEGFLVLDVVAAPGFDPQQMYIPGDGHWNAAGHEFVAQRIAEFIQRQDLLAQAQK